MEIRPPRRKKIGHTENVTATESFDVVIVGAGISGIGAAYRINERNPGLTYTILERRSNVGGTWDLFRFPGIRSDSSIFTLSFPFEPWQRSEGIADGLHIREYLTDTARKHGIYRAHPVRSSRPLGRLGLDTDTWTVHADRDGADTTFTGRFVFFATGYYNYDQGYTPDFPGIDQFTGRVVHPQHWPPDLDYTGKTMVVIGSGATAVTLVPSLADRADKVVMLQRTPSYIGTFPRTDTLTKGIRKILPRRVFHSVIRFRNALQEAIGCVPRAQDPGRHEVPLPADANQAAAGGLRHRHTFQPAVQTVGPADLPGRRRRPVRRDQRRARRDGRPTRSTTSMPAASHWRRVVTSRPTSS